MKALILLCLTWWIAAGVGSLIMERLKLLQDHSLERFTFASALGLGVAAYGVLALGLSGLLAFWPITVWWIALACIGFTGMRANGRVLIRWVHNTLSRRKNPEENRPTSLLTYAASIVLIIAAGITILACFRPPGGHEWDALAYHLADPKIYLLQHRIINLPTEHHSNFPFTMEMLYTVGLVYDGYALANLYHCLTAILTVMSLLSFCQRVFQKETGILAAIVFVTTPIVLWESSVAYIDVALSLYITLSFFAGISLLRAKKEASASNEYTWAMLAGILMGLALSIKYLALLPMSFLALILLLRRVSPRVIAVYLALALAVASPWYIKNIVTMQNPVYPYVYRVFPQSRYWSADRAKPYEEEQKSFGYEHSLLNPLSSLQNILLSPWRLITNPARYTNTGDFTFTSLIGGLYFAFLFALICRRRYPFPVSDLLLFSGLMLLSWFFVSQHSRYLLPVLPILALLAGYSANSLLNGEAFDNRDFIPLQFVKWLTGIVLAAHCFLVFLGLVLLPSGGREALEALGAGLPPTALSVSDTLSQLSRSEQEKMLRRRLDNYSAVEWINQNTPESAGVILYEDVHGYYLNRLYLWGNREHSSYIPYDEMKDGQQLTDWLKSHHIEYVLINLNAAPDNDQTLQNRPAGRELDMLRLWYVDKAYNENDWRRLLGDAIRKGQWIPVFADHGVVVLKITENNEGKGATP